LVSEYNELPIDYTRKWGIKKVVDMVKRAMEE
jgi:hypothetical protein